MTATISGDTGIDLIQDGAVATADIANGAVTPAKQSQPMTLGTAQATTSGTSIDFTGIPSWVKRITVMLNGVSTNAASDLLIQIGSGSVATSGYVSRATSVSAQTASTTGYILTQAQAAADLCSGSIVISNLSSLVWVAGGNLNNVGANGIFMSAGHCTLAGSLDRVRITTVSGTAVFDAGSANILYEG